MTYTIEHLNEARDAKRERACRGEDCGDYRGSVKPRLPSPLEDDLEQGICELVASLVFKMQSNHDFLTRLLIRDAEDDFEIPF